MKYKIEISYENGGATWHKSYVKKWWGWRLLDEEGDEVSDVNIDSGMYRHTVHKSINYAMDAINKHNKHIIFKKETKYINLPS